jgi:hypothetical protein
LAAAAAIALAPMAAMTMATPAVSSAQPLDCEGGQFYDPVGNACQPIGPQPLNCEGGQFFDPVGNACRPIGPQPLGCEDGQFWDPVGNVCRPVVP